MLLGVHVQWGGGEGDAKKIPGGIAIPADLVQQQGEVREPQGGAQPGIEPNLQLPAIEVPGEVEDVGFHRYFRVPVHSGSGSHVGHPVVLPPLQQRAGEVHPHRGQGSPQGEVQVGGGHPHQLADAPAVDNGAGEVEIGSRFHGVPPLEEVRSVPGLWPQGDRAAGSPGR